MGRRPELESDEFGEAALLSIHQDILNSHLSEPPPSLKVLHLRIGSTTQLHTTLVPWSSIHGIQTKQLTLSLSLSPKQLTWQLVFTSDTHTAVVLLCRNPTWSEVSPAFVVKE